VCLRARVGRCRLSLLVRLSARIFTLLARSWPVTPTMTAALSLLARLAAASSPFPPPSSPTTSPSPTNSSPVYMSILIPIEVHPPDHLPSPPPLLCVTGKGVADRTCGRAGRREGVRACVHTVVPCMPAWRHSYSCVSIFVCKGVRVGMPACVCEATSEVMHHTFVHLAACVRMSVRC